MGSESWEDSVLTSPTRPSTTLRWICTVLLLRSMSAHFRPKTSLIRSPRKPATIAIVRYGSRSSCKTRSNSAIVNAGGLFKRLLPPFALTSSIGLLLVSSRFRAHLNTKLMIPRMCALDLGANDNPFNHCSTGSGLIASRFSADHRGAMWFLISEQYTVRVI